MQVNVIGNCLFDVRCIIFGGKDVLKTIETINNLNMFSVVRLIDLPSIKHLQYNNKKIDVLIMKEEEIKDFISSEKCQNQNAYTHQITVFFFCKRKGFSQQLIKSLTRLWKCSFLNVYAMCLGSMNKITVYTFNPYSGRELLKWKKYEPKTKKMRDKIRMNMSCYSRVYLKGR